MLCRIETDTDTYCPGNSQVAVKWLAAMMSCADTDTRVSKIISNIIYMHILDGKRPYPERVLGRRMKHLHTFLLK